MLMPTFRPVTRKVFLKLPPPNLDDNIADVERLKRELNKRGYEMADIHINLPIIRKIGSAMREKDWAVTVTLLMLGNVIEVMDVQPGDTTRRRYGVAVDVIDQFGAKSILTAIEQKPIVVIDEIGKMELFSSAFQAAVLKAVGSPKLVVATAMIDNHPWVAALKAFPGVTVWEVTKKNRTGMVKDVIGWINSAASRKSNGGSDRS